MCSPPQLRCRRRRRVEAEAKLQKQHISSSVSSCSLGSALFSRASHIYRSLQFSIRARRESEEGAWCTICFFFFQFLQSIKPSIEHVVVVPLGGRKIVLPCSSFTRDYHFLPDFASTTKAASAASAPRLHYYYSGREMPFSSCFHSPRLFPFGKLQSSATEKSCHLAK